tara:strand:- start:68 stop:307 length:240 start_codon:yes stop_codon:yes gene_type:complete
MKTYVIINANEVSLINFSEVLETSANTLRYNNDGTKTFVKYIGNQPSFLNGKTTYTESEIKALLNDEKGEWYREVYTGE